MVTRNNDLLMLALSKFFMNQSNVDRLLQVIECRSAISLRLLDYFVTNYAKKVKTTVVCKATETTVMCVHSNYRLQLKAFSKQQFDPFRRRERIMFEFSNKHVIETTVGQLNFFRWAIEVGILEYVAAHKDTIEADMVSSMAVDEQKRRQQKDGVSGAPKLRTRVPREPCRQQLSQMHVTVFESPRRVQFE